MFVVDKVVQEYRRHRMLLAIANELHSITLPDWDDTSARPTRTTRFYLRGPHSACRVTESVCKSHNSSASTRPLFQANRERTHELLPTLPQGASLFPFPFTYPRLVCQQSSSNHSYAHNIPSSYDYYDTTSSPTPQNTPHASLSHFPPRGTRVVALLLKQVSSKLEMGAKVTLTPLIKLIIGETNAGEHRNIMRR